MIVDPAKEFRLEGHRENTFPIAVSDGIYNMYIMLR